MQAPSTVEVAPQAQEGRFREVLGPAGNEYVDAPETAGEAGAAELEFSDLPEAVQEVARAIIPDGAEYDIEIDEEDEGIVYDVEAEAAGNDYDVELWPDGRPYEIDYEPDEGPAEKSEELVVAGGLTPIELDALPAPVSGAAAIFPGLEATKAWDAQTVAGQRYLVQLEKDGYATVVGITPDGQIRTADEPEDMLEEVAPPQTADGAPAGATQELIARLLGPHKDKYNVANTIERIQQVPVDPAEGFRFVALGDSRSDEEVWNMIAESINKYDPVFAINTGDLVPKGKAQEFADYLIPTLDAKATDYEFLPVMGNHDSGDDGKQYDYLFGEGARVYRFHYGDSVFVVLDNGSKGARMPWDEQLALADTWLAEPPNEHKFVFMHKPPASVPKWAYHAASSSESLALTELMTRHEVDHVFLGHIHAYSTAEVGGVGYTITGGAGAGLHDQYGPEGSVHHYVIVDVTSDGVEQQVVRFYEK
jgi:predicted phosphodiesterase